MIFDAIAKTFNQGELPQCGTFITDHITGATASMHTYAGDTPNGNDTCQCGALFYCAAVALSEA